MEQITDHIAMMSIEEREEVFVNLARTLEWNAREAYVEGDEQFAVLSKNMADAIRINADELARQDPEHSGRAMAEATAIISQFNATHPYRMVSAAIH